MTFLELAEQVLSEVKKPLPVSEIWRYAENKGYSKQLSSLGKTPAATLGALLYVNARDNKHSRFSVMGSRPKKFFLKNLKYAKGDLIEEDLEVGDNEDHAVGFLEKDLHAVLIYFIYYHLNAFSKTLNHTKSTKKQYGEWVHPDVIACYFPIEDWKPEVYDLSMTIKDTPIKLMSFEIKRQLNFGNLRESFFQAVSNSSWSHEGYLVASLISDEKEFIGELARLSASFGIGVILLDVEDPDNSEILLPAKERESLDWETINKLTINSDFKDFLKRIKKDIETKEIRKEWYDKVEERDRLIKSFKNRRLNKIKV